MGTVYLLGEFCDNGRFKIGITTKTVDVRLKQLQTGNSQELFIVNHYTSKNYRPIERYLHRKYCPDRAMGEWFSLSPEAVNNFISDAVYYDNIITNTVDDISIYDMF
jgi:hypothetical protein